MPPGSGRALLLFALVLPIAAAADPPPGAESAPSSEAPSGLDPSLGADEIYRRVLANRFASSVQELSLVSGDRAGREQPIRVQMLWRRYDEASDEHTEGILSRTLVRYLEPSDVRGSGYLIINKDDVPDDQFLYLTSRRRTRRINLRSETVIGTDLSVEDILPREMEDATYMRAPDDEIDGGPCFVVEATPVANAESHYSRFLLYVEPVHFVPLRTRYWDHAGVEVKELRSEADSIREIQGIWIPLRAVMRHRLDDTYTSLEVAMLTPNPSLPKPYFTQRQLETRRFRLPEGVEKDAITFESGLEAQGG